MNRSAALAGAALLAVTLPSPLRAVDGNTFYELCSREPGTSGVCLGYIVGFVEGVEFTSFASTSPAGTDAAKSRAYCAPPGVTYGEIIDVVKKWTEEHPEHRHLGAKGLVTLSLNQAFPCPP